MSELGLVYVKEVPMVKVKLVAKEINIKGAPMQIVIQYWTKDGKLVASGEVNKFDEPKMNNVASHNSSASVQGKKAIDCAIRHIHTYIISPMCRTQRSRFWRSVQPMPIYAGMQLRFP